LVLIFFPAFSENPKSIKEAVQEMTEGNTEAYLGLTDSIVEMIKFSHPSRLETSEEEKAAAIQKVISIYNM
jgi:hypothetical protein